jgi:hypothetical protein
MDFEGQRPGEELLFIFRRHIVSAWRSAIFFLALVVLGFLPVILWPENSRMIFLWIIFVLVGFAGLAYSYMLWYFSVYIVTDQRIRQISQKGFFNKTVVDLDLMKIESVSVGTSGFLSGIFNYGTLLIQTNAGDLVISRIRYPEKVYNELQNTLHNFEKKGDYA